MTQISTTESGSEKAPIQEKTAEKPTEKPAVPEAYEFKVPEGLKLDPAVVEKVTPIFKEAGLSQDVAQRLMDVHVEQIQALAKGPQEAYEKLRTDWRNEVVGDKSLGDGTGLKPEVKATLGRAIDSMGGEAAQAFREAMELTGAGDHPAVIRGLYAMAQFMTEGRPLKAGGPAPVSPPGKPASAAKAMFPNLP